MIPLYVVIFKGTLYFQNKQLLLSFLLRFALVFLISFLFAMVVSSSYHVKSFFSLDMTDLVYYTIDENM